MAALGLSMEEGDYGRLHRGGASQRLSKRLPGREVKEKISRPRESQEAWEGSGVLELGAPQSFWWDRACRCGTSRSVRVGTGSEARGARSSCASCFEPKAEQQFSFLQRVWDLF